MKLVKTVLTRTSEAAPQKSTVLTIDFTGCTPEQVAQFAARGITIDAQRDWRKNGIPATSTILVRELIAGTRVSEPATVENTLARASALSKEELKKLIDSLKEQVK